jgi:phenylacetate-CoA ligase
MNTWADWLYPRLPIPAQNLACSFYGWRESRKRFGSSFEKSLAFLQAFQNEQLAKLVKHAYENVPYYREIMKERGLVPSDITTVADLPKLPVLTKEDVRQNAARLLATNASRHEQQRHDWKGARLLCDT